MSFEDARKDCDYPQDGLKDPCSVAVNFMCVRAAEDGNFDGFSLSLTVPGEADADRVFAALSEGGTVKMPLTKTFWSPRFGMLTDRFGLGWMITVMA